MNPQVLRRRHCPSAAAARGPKIRTALGIRPLLALALALVASFVASPALAGTTDTLPAGVWAVDVSYVMALTDKQFDKDGNEAPLLEPIRRYEAGGGLQGVLTARPTVDMRLIVTQLMYGITDRWVLAFALPTSLRSTIKTNLGWTPGDWNSTLGRPYSEQDFWEWAGSMGQPKPDATWVGNVNTPADLVIGSRWRLPDTPWMERNNVRWSVMVQGALPTGRDPDPEKIIELGTTGWWLHNYGDLELHLAADWRWRDSAGLDRLTVGLEAYYAWLRTRTLKTPTGRDNPLLLTYAPYVGETHTVDGGDWQVGRLSVDIAPIVGPTFGTWMTKGSVEAASKFPALLTINMSYDFVYLQPTVWTSNDPLWSADRGKYWGQGYKHAFSATAALSLMRVGAPLQFYVRQRSLDLIPGKNMRPANATTVGVRLIAKFW